MPSQTSSRRSDGSYLSSGSSTSSQISASSSYRHHHADLIPTPTKPQPILLQDAQHAPKTRGSLGLLIVGLGGQTGLAVTAGIVANRSNISWKGAKGEPRQASYQACHTQPSAMTTIMPSDFHLANANLAAIGGWVSPLIPVLISKTSFMLFGSHKNALCPRTFVRPNSATLL
jgi:Myo-inositol-1-phosphate synthase